MDANWQSLTPERPNSLKRRATFEEDDDNQPLESPPSDVKKHRQRSAIDNISLVSLGQAWDVDLKTILPHNQYPYPAMFVLCVVGSLTHHHDLLCSPSPALCIPTSLPIHPVLLIPSPSATSRHYYSSITSTPSSAVLHLLTHSPLPVLPTPQQTFIRLGLFHPSGSQPLDAIVLLDWCGRRRLVVPFGWGAGKWVGGIGGNSNAHHAEELMGALGDGVRELSAEWEGSVEKAEWEERRAMGMDGKSQAGAGAEDYDANGEMAIDE
ncbi:hypothetical protein EV356DRAFT_528435 [Viridothelium virens]|uniref:Uncharacterized protein n=1 Tax=Viridothelium virens TaxID=1048519 RepID=A0A6A6HLX9_VIRVR|nr:hypothetical protein EV356DRAFT_528435 [Viridothelium virens]